MEPTYVIVIIAITLIMYIIFLPLVPLAAEGKSIPSLPNFGNTYHVKGETCIRLTIKPLSSSRFAQMCRICHYRTDFAALC